MARSKPTPTPVGREVKRLRGRMSQEELGFRVGVSQSDISKIERGQTKQPAKNVLRKIARALQSPPNELLILADYAPDTYEDIGEPIIAPDVFVQYWGRVPADAVRWTAAVSEERSMLVQAEWIGDRAADQFFVVRASGDCLMRRGIVDGTFVLCELSHGRIPSDGQIVAIRVGDERSLKIWHRTSDGIDLLNGENEVVVTLHESDDIEVVGFWVAHWQSREQPRSTPGSEL